MTHDLFPADETASTAAASASRRVAITATVVPDGLRLNFLPNQFGPKLMMIVEQAVYDWMRRLCSSYTGGYWNYIELSNGGGYLQPTGQPYFDLAVEGNHFDARVSPDVAGIVVTAFALNSMLWKGFDVLNGKYEQLLAYIAVHPECATIRRALD
ncbi:antirestriction protein [Biomphalaria pfeifferi]|uniref:Antirestriction protein n=1 Tax=Biomphalaria pfeifferi TaxID=112525 RepID=A0AAD8APD7_BIOPF|nr:antirestriction protein [Biomphalaria pfeifferi]